MNPLGRILRMGRNLFGRMQSEAALLPRCFAPRDGKPRAIFFLSGPLEGASLLRGQCLADALTGYGWHTIVVPWTIKRGGRARMVRLFRPDILIFQQCRHPLNDVHMTFGLPYVVDTDDADFHLHALPGLPERLDRMVRGAAGVIAGSRYLRDHHRARNAKVAVVWTGTPTSTAPWPTHRERSANGTPILTWAQAQPLSYARELDFVVALEKRLRTAGSHHRLRFYGIDTDAARTELAARFGPESDLEMLPTLEYQDFLASLREVAVGLSPIVAQSEFSRGKSFGKILGYLDAGVPVVTSDEADHALFFTPESGVVSNDPAVWEQSVLALLADPDRRERMAEHAAETFRARLSIDAAARQVDRFLRTLLPTPCGERR